MPRPEYTTDDRRSFMKSAAKNCLGVTFAGAVGSQALFGEEAAAAVGKAKHIIYLFMDGAMTHLDTFDPKVGVEEAGETKPIQTRVPGMQFGNFFPKMAYLSGAIAVVRSLSTETGAHDKGKYLMRTAYKKLNSIQHPAMGAWMVAEKGRLNSDLPGNYIIGSGDGHPGAGFLEPSLSPVPISSASAGLQNTQLPKYLPEELFGRRLTLATKFDEVFQRTRKNPNVEAYNQLYLEARRLMGSPHLKVFDIKEEPQAVRDAYGNNQFGQALLLSRRLVESGARFIEVTYGGWDMHQEIYTRLESKANDVDTGISSLMRDLHSKGLLKDTMIVLTTEFGRKPQLNVNGGRDHHPGAFSSLLIGAGIKGGQVYGGSDKTGFSVAKDAVSVSAFNKTIAAAAGLPLTEERFAPNGRPFKIGGDAAPIKELLA
ncbi:MAG: DUF1501 domain-containing protein [Pirellulaceae bacterium]